MELRQFNALFLAELNRYRRDLRHLASGSVAHPLLRVDLLRMVQDDLEMDGFQKTYERWRGFIGIPKPKPLNLPPSPVLGLQLNFSGRAEGGKQMLLATPVPK